MVSCLLMMWVVIDDMLVQSGPGRDDTPVKHIEDEKK